MAMDMRQVQIHIHDHPGAIGCLESAMGVAAALLRDLMAVLVDDLMNAVTLACQHRRPQLAPALIDQLGEKPLPPFDEGGREVMCCGAHDTSLIMDATWIRHATKTLIRSEYD
jgi:hypothetical protein